jgi:inner membrane protein
MMYYTHILTGIIGAYGPLYALDLAVHQHKAPWILGATLGSLLPDISNPSSYMGAVCGPASRWIHNNHGHRKGTHSSIVALLLFMAAIVANGLFPNESFLTFSMAFCTGFLLHGFMDMPNGQGVMSLWPFSRKWFVVPRDPKKRLHAKSTAEIIIVLVLILSFGLESPVFFFGSYRACGFHFTGLGQFLGDYVCALGADQIATARLQGYWAASGLELDSTFNILRVTDKNHGLILKEPKTGNLYKAVCGDNASYRTYTGPVAIVIEKAEIRSVAEKILKVTEIKKNRGMLWANEILPGGFVEGRFVVSRSSPLLKKLAARLSPTDASTVNPVLSGDNTVTVEVKDLPSQIIRDICPVYFLECRLRNVRVIAGDHR